MLEEEAWDHTRCDDCSSEDWDNTDVERTFIFGKMRRKPEDIVINSVCDCVSLVFSVSSMLSNNYRVGQTSQLIYPRFLMRIISLGNITLSSSKKKSLKML